MKNESTTLDLGFYLTDFFPVNIPDVFSTKNVDAPLILVESPEFDTRFLLRSFLLSCNYEVLESENSDQSEILIAEEKPRILLLDLASSFEENLKQIKRSRENRGSRGRPIIAFSDFIESSQQEQLQAAGANDLLLKPINFKALETLIKIYLEETEQNRFIFGGLL